MASEHRAPTAPFAALLTTGLLAAATTLVLGLVAPAVALPAGVTTSGVVIVASGAALLRWGAGPGGPRPRHRTLGGGAALVYGSGQLVLGLQPLVTGSTPSYPAPGDLLSFGAAPLGLLMLVALPRPPGTTGRLRRLLPDALVGGLAGALLVWRLVFLDATPDWHQALVAAAAVAIELTLVALVLQIAVAGLDRGTAVLTLGLLHLVAADTLTSRVALQVGAQTPWGATALQCLAWPLICTGLALAAGRARQAAQGRHEADDQARAESRASWTTVLLLAGCAVGAAAAAPRARVDLVTAALLVALLLALGVREVVLQRLRVRQVGALNHLADHDPLTGLGNRRAVQAELARTPRDRVGVLVLDLDGFKGVNDQLGHSSGDALLVEVAAALRGIAPGELTAFRLGGDEFALVGAVGAARAAEVAGVVSGAVAAAAARVPGVDRVRLSASTGVSGARPGSAPGDVTAGAMALLARASTAMQVAKRSGRDRVVVYDDAVDAEARRRAAVDARLGGALERGEVVAHLQPLVDLAGGRVVGFEALARWHDEELGAVPPLEFVAAAEASGLVVALGRSVLRSALAALVLCDGVERRLTVAVNASAVELRAPGSVEGFASALREYGVAADLLVVEVTESVLVGVDDPAVAALVALRAMGVSVSVDDFGTGYSSLAYLTRLPIDVLKVDRSLVVAVAEPATRAVVQAVVTMAGALGLTVVAEGIEHAWQAEAMAALGAHHGQGWLWSPALPPAEAAALVATSPRPGPARQPTLPGPGSVLHAQPGTRQPHGSPVTG